jgi:hypothetical protein
MADFITVFAYSICSKNPMCKPFLGGFCGQINSQRPESFAGPAKYITLAISYHDDA